ncbi:MAG: hypothetical protein QXT86_13610 [Archaeoglobaceae archaeon]
MIDMIEMSPGESAIIDTTANIVSIINLTTRLDVYKEGEGNVLIKLGWGEIFSLGVSQGRFIIINNGDITSRVYIVRQFIL